MQRVRLRKFVLVAALAVVAGVGLAGCQSQPGVAGYVGSTRFTDADIEATANQVQADVDKLHPGQAFQFGDLRAYLVHQQVANEVLKRYASEQHVAVPAIDYAAAAETDQLSESDQVVRLAAEQDAYVTALVDAAKPVTPTDADLRAVYARANESAGGGLPPYEQIKSSLASYPKLGNALALKAALADAAKRYGVSISPRYGAAEIPLLRTMPDPSNPSQPPIELVGVTIGAPNGEPAVTDLPSPTPSA
jgi:hypothetical protein